MTTLNTTPTAPQADETTETVTSQYRLFIQDLPSQHMTPSPTTNPLWGFTGDNGLPAPLYDRLYDGSQEARAAMQQVKDVLDFGFISQRRQPSFAI
ncbi:MAG: hypothetical protein KC476_05675 [Cyanobacteria bacterium HKST-UBA06]|nr:hypothetical protein [Cyanobacteria bacterium HKST-UBA06]MCA9841306.1 hypothetical protein [Cyanobacteria bacterium HKST-UBA03]